MPSDEEATGGVAPGSPAGRRASHRTAVALFDDAIDAEGALRSLEKGAGSPEQVSLLIRARDVDPDDAADRPGVVARSLVATTLEAVGGWLLGLASLVVPERGTYLVAGPLGAALSGANGAWRSNSEAAMPRDRPGMFPPGSTELPTTAMLQTLAGFGFSQDEATYLEHRLAAGAVLIAVTSTDPRQLGAIRRLFADHDAVHINQGQAENDEAAAATAALTALLRAAGGDDGAEHAAPPLHRLCGRDADGPLAAACGAGLIDRFGDEAGTVDDVLSDDPDERPTPVVRYVVVAFGGLLGLGRQHVAVPAALVDLASRPAHVAIERKVLQHAPRFAGDAPFTRRDELALCAYFGSTPYWLDEA